MFREPKSKVFVLQATMRCLRAIGQAQHTGHVFLSDDNLNTLNDELQQNFRISADELQKTGKDKVRVEVRVVECGGSISSDRSISGKSRSTRKKTEP